ncbi:MAG: serine/threonine protein kinase, partial [Xanthomonadales bacterium]|nr:serine/threonine protein kinase [Xanthomonadales bacterium]
FAGEGADRRFFLREGRLLARLQHPGIARLLDAGEADDGCPYLVMEYLQGQPLDRHCADRQVSAAERIALVRDAALAVAHAHTLLVLHRDLKPANLLVTDDGQLKVLDFGIAKPIDDDSAREEVTTARYFTLRYAAPEQVLGEPVGTATDVYALAVVLFELLTGRHPYLPEGADARSLVSQALTRQPLSLRRALQAAKRPWPLGEARLRDLDALLEKALLRGDGAVGHASMAAFAEDLQAVLEDRPLSLRRTPMIERTWRWLRRHRLAAASMTLGVLGLLVGSAVALWQAQLARVERDSALHEAERAERIAGFLTGMFTAPRPIENQGAPLAASELLDRARERLQDELADDPLLRVQLTATLAETYRALGLYETAEQLLIEALAVPLPDSDAPQRSGLLLQLGRVLSFQARWPEADAQLWEAADLARLQGDLATLAQALGLRVTAQLNLQQLDAAEPLAREALSVQQARQPPDPQALRQAEQVLAAVAMQRGDLASARQTYQQSADRIRADLGDDAVERQMTLNNLAAVELRMDLPEAAAANYRESIRIARVRLGPDHRDQALPQLGLGMALRVVGSTEDAIAQLREAVQIYRQWDGAEHPATAYAQLLLAETLWLSAQAEQARNALGTAPKVLYERNGARNGQTCRASMLQLVLSLPTSAPADAEAWDAAVSCLADPAAPAAMQLLAAWGSQQRQAALAAPISPGERDALAAQGDAM